MSSTAIINTPEVVAWSFFPRTLTQTFSGNKIEIRGSQGRKDRERATFFAQVCVCVRGACMQVCDSACLRACAMHSATAALYFCIVHFCSSSLTPRLLSHLSPMLPLLQTGGCSSQSSGRATGSTPRGLDGAAAIGARPLCHVGGHQIRALACASCIHGG